MFSDSFVVSINPLTGGFELTVVGKINYQLEIHRQDLQDSSMMNKILILQILRYPVNPVQPSCQIQNRG
jgi:hypothetical protein